MTKRNVSSSSTARKSSGLTKAKSHSSYGGSNSNKNSRRPVGRGADFPANSDGHMGSSGGNLSRTNLYIRGLSPTTTDEDLVNMCAKFGDIVSTKAIQDKAGSSSKGYGFVLFSEAKSAEMAVAELTKTGVQAQLARVSTDDEPQSKQSSYQTGKRSMNLTNNRSQKQRRTNAAKGVSVVFDQDERIQFVKGFAKRKQERRDRAKQETLTKENEIRKLLRQKRKEALKRELPPTLLTPPATSSP